MFSPIIERAIELAAEWHDQTYRKSRWRDEFIHVPARVVGPARVPVMAHVTAVAMTVQRAGLDDETIAAAFLHDILEDRNCYGDHMSERSLRVLVGDTVTDLVLGVTEPKFDLDGEPMPWRKRKQTYVDQLEEASDGSVAISLADKLHNAWTMAQSLEAGFDIFTSADGRKGLSAGPVEQLWFFNAVLRVGASRDDARLAPMAAALAAEVDRFARLAGVRDA